MVRKESFSLSDMYVVYVMTGLVNSYRLSNKLMYAKMLAEFIIEKTRNTEIRNGLRKAIKDIEELEPEILHLEKTLEYIHQEYEARNIPETPEILKLYSKLETQVFSLITKVLLFAEKVAGELPVSIIKLR